MKRLFILTVDRKYAERVEVREVQESTGIEVYLKPINLEDGIAKIKRLSESFGMSCEYIGNNTLKLIQ